MKRLARLAAATVLAAAVLAVYGQIIGHEFTTWDDDLHVTANPVLVQSFGTALTRFWLRPFAGLYIPVSYTVILAEWHLPEVFGGQAGDPRVFHFVSLLLHFGCAWTVYRLLLRLKCHRAPALVGSLLFALHPLQVESVSWISETRGLLASLGSLLCLLAYVRSYGHDAKRLEVGAEDGTETLMPAGPAFPWLAFGIFVLALLAKPAAVATLPMILALEIGLIHSPWKSLLVRLGPWLLPALLVTFLTGGEQRDLLEQTPAWFRPLVAGDALGFYLRKLIIPVDLGIDYGRSPTQLKESTWFWLGWAVPTALVLAITLLPGRRGFLTALGLFVAGLLPVLGLVPFAYQYYSTVADRYVYLAMLGPAFALSSFTGAVLATARIGKGGAAPRFRLQWVLPLCALAVLVALVVLSSRQAATWKNDETLYAQALRINPRSFVSWNNLGAGRARQGETRQAEEWFRRAIVIRPDFAPAHRNLGLILLKDGRTQEAMRELRAAAEMAPWDALAAYDFATALSQQGKGDEAQRYYEAALNADPEFAAAHNGLGNILLLRGDTQSAAAHYRAALAQSATFVEARVNLGNALLLLGRTSDAVREYNEALRLSSELPEVHHNLGAIAMQDSDWPSAEKSFRESLRLRPDNPGTHMALGEALERQGLPEDAIATYSAAVRLDPQSAPAHLALGNLLQGRTAEERGLAGSESRNADNPALFHLREAVRIAPENPAARMSLGIALESAGQIDEAIAQLRSAVSIDLELPLAHYHLGTALHAAGRAEEATRSLRTALRIVPEGSRAASEIQQKLRAIQADHDSGK